MRSKQSSDKRSSLVVVSLPTMKCLASLNKGVVNLERREKRREGSEEWSDKKGRYKKKYKQSS